MLDGYSHKSIDLQSMNHYPTSIMNLGTAERFLQNPATTGILVVIFFIVSTLLLLSYSDYELTSDVFLGSLHYLLLANMAVWLISAIVSPDKMIRIVYIIMIAGTFAFLVIYRLLILWLAGLSKAFIHG